MQQLSLFYCTCFTRSSHVPQSGSMLKTIKRTGIFLTTSWECYKRLSVKSAWSVAVSRKGKETFINCLKICGNQSLPHNKALHSSLSSLSTFNLPLFRCTKPHQAAGCSMQPHEIRDLFTPQAWKSCYITQGACYEDSGSGEHFFTIPLNFKCF